MSAVTPILCALEPFSVELKELIDQSLNGIKYFSRSSISLWRHEITQEILTQDSEEYLHAIKAWLHSCTWKTFDDLPDLEVVEAFMEVQLRIRGGDTTAATRTLACLQKRLEIDKFSGNEHQHHQHNLLEELTSTVEDLVLEDIETEGEESHPEEDSLDTSYFSPEEDKSNSPPRKKRRTTTTTSEVRKEIVLDLNEHLKANPIAWLETCKAWTHDLTTAFEHRQELDLSDDTCDKHYKKVVHILQDLRQIKAGVYKNQTWIDAVKSSGLAKIIYLWSDPMGLALWQAVFVKKLFRKHKISTTLLLVLERWIPTKVKSIWVLQPFVPYFTREPKQKLQKLGRYLYQCFTKKPDMIPRESYPPSVFFLLSLDNFFEAGRMWLGFSLEKNSFHSTFFNSRSEAEIVYKALMQHLSGFGDADFNRIEDIALRTIFKRSIDFKDLKRKVKEKFFANRASLNSPCKKCRNESASEQCLQKVLVTVQKPDKSVIGCGVSFSPREKIDAIPMRNSKNGELEERPVLHPKLDLHLKDIRCSDKILERCGSMTYYFADKNDPDTILDFWTYNAFPDHVLEKLISHHQRLQTVKNVKRGKQFKTYRQGHMFPKGSRIPAGGLPGDAYTMYTGMDAIDEASINALFDDAEDSLVLLEAARIIHPPVFSQLQHAVPEGDKLGITGATAYLCKNYASPLHFDKDACRGLCAQYHLQAKSEGDEYGFIFGDYGLYVVSRSNSFWSFDSSMAHGTVLPSTDVLEFSDIQTAVRAPSDDRGDRGNDPPRRISSGAHVTKSKKDINAARKYKKVQDSRKNIGEYLDC
ncbi:hypothetical protein CVT26_008884 [Gymnopilus dilepis]|uniref:Uncharacterized protein n=1 Tax=Gymnopilus dilepis TaxID=231916 RepID=A0A409YAY0_9AGAR|nr:hypothetical protein CVT26_008884 [Gymnopilus dilepis]